MSLEPFGHEVHLVYQVLVPPIVYVLVSHHIQALRVDRSPVVELHVHHQSAETVFGSQFLHALPGNDHLRLLSFVLRRPDIYTQANFEVAVQHQPDLVVEVLHSAVL